MDEVAVAIAIDLILEVLTIQQRRIDELMNALETLESSVATLEGEETPLKLAVEEAVTHLKSLETEVKTLETGGSITPEKAQQLTEKINNAAAAVTVAVTALKGA